MYSHSIVVLFRLLDNIAPGKVWVIEAFLYDDDVDEANSSRKNHAKIDSVYSLLRASANPNMIHPPLNLSLTPPTASKWTHGNWRKNKRKPVSPSLLPNRFTSHHSSSLSDNKPPPPPVRDPPSYKPFSSSVSSSSDRPLSSSTPQQQRPTVNQRGSITSEDGIQLSPGLTRVKYNLPTTSLRKPNSQSPIANRKRHKTAGDEDDYEDIDALDEINPSMALPARVVSRRLMAAGGDTSGNDAPPPLPPPLTINSTNGSPLGQSRHSTGSLSSDGFTTPPPIPLSRPNQQAGLCSIYDDRDHGTANDPEYETIEDTRRNGKEGEGGGGRPALARNASEMTDEEIEKLVNTPITLPHNDQPKVAILSSVRQQHQRVPTLPTEMRSWKVKATAKPDSDDDDFVNSTELQEMLLANRLDKKQSPSSAAAIPPSENKKKEEEEEEEEEEGKEKQKWDERGWSSRTPSPPPLPPREYTLSIMRKSGGSEKVKLPVAMVVGQLSKQTVVPPLHVRHVTGVEGPGILYSEHDIDGSGAIDVDGTLTTEQVQRPPSWLYSDDLDNSQVKNNSSAGACGGVVKATEEATLADVQRENNSVTVSSSDSKTTALIAQTETACERERTITGSQSKPACTCGPKALAVNGNHTSDVKLINGAVSGSSEPLHTEKRMSTSVDTWNGAGSMFLSVPGTTEEKRTSFTSSVVSDDVFNDQSISFDDTKVRTSESRESIGEDSVITEVSIQSSTNEDVMSERLPSFTTDIDLSTLKMEESFMEDGTITPAQMTLNESMVNRMRYRGRVMMPDPVGGCGTAEDGEEDENELLDSAEYSSLPEDDDEDEEGKMDPGSKTSTMTDRTESNYDALGRPLTKSWITKTMERSKTPVRETLLIILG